MRDGKGVKNNMMTSLIFLLMLLIPCLLFAFPHMARIKLGAILSDIRGELQNGVYSIWKTGVHYIRNIAPVISNPHSTDQAYIRFLMSEYSKDWFDTLTEAQRENWNDWAQTKPGQGNGDGGIYNIIKGNNGIMSGFNAFIMANQWLSSAGCGAVTAAPIGVTPPSAPRNVAASYLDPDVTVTWIAPDTVKAGARVRIWLYHRQQLIHKQLVQSAAYDDLTADITNVKGANGDSVAIADYLGDYLIQMDCVDPDGTKGPPSNTCAVEVT